MKVFSGQRGTDKDILIMFEMSSDIFVKTFTLSIALGFIKPMKV